ncbi:MAG: type II toxin-antitoxin system Phd/YefM family antitoxin [Gammaproteobacteria bacterium]
MHTINIYEAKTHLSRLLEQVSHGEEIIIGKAGKPIAKLIPFHAEKQVRKPGYWKGKVNIHPDFDELPADFMAAFQDNPDDKK